MHHYKANTHKLTIDLSSPHRAAQLLALRSDLTAYISSLARTSHISSQTCAAEAASYDAEAAQVQAEHEEHVARVAELKAELEAARVERGNKLTYDEVVGQMGRMGARSETQEEMRQIEADIRKLEKQSEALGECAATSQQRYSTIVEDLQGLASALGQAQLSDDMDEDAEEEDSNGRVPGDDDSDAEARVLARAAAVKALNPAAQPFRPSTRFAAAAAATTMSASSSVDSPMETDTRKRGRETRSSRSTRSTRSTAATAASQPALKRRKDAEESAPAGGVSSAEEGEA